MPITIVLAGPQQRAQAIRAIEQAVPRTRITFSDPALTDAQLTLLRIILSDIIEQSGRSPLKTAPEWELLLTAACFSEQGLIGFEADRFVVRGLRFEELTVEQASEQIEFLYAFGAQRGVIFREKKPS
jgi:NinB protein